MFSFRTVNFNSGGNSGWLNNCCGQSFCFCRIFGCGEISKMKNYSLLKLEKKLGEPAENLPSGHSQFHSKMAFLPFLNAFGAAAVLLALALTFASCTKNSIQQKNQKQSEKNAGFSVDFDLTKMNANMVYAQVFNLMLEPQNFGGKTFKIKGNFIKVNGPDGQPSYAVIIKDALACCQQGLEFKYDFAGKEPVVDQEITVIGKYTLTETPDGFSHNYLTAQTCD